MILEPVQWQVTVGDGVVSAAFEPCNAVDASVFLCAHGAGGNMSDRGVLAVTKVLREHGLHTVRFNFPYKERKSGRPDPMPMLTACIDAVADHVRRALRPARLIIGGRSMGGRAASMLAAEGFASDGLLLLAYPLHPPGRLDKLRDAHLPAIAMPALCINGTRDDFCNRELMEQVLARVQPTFRMHWVEGADHSFHVLKASGRKDADILQEIGMTVRGWLRT